MLQTSLTRSYNKDSSSLFTKFLYVQLPLLGAGMLLLAKEFLSDEATSAIENFVGDIPASHKADTFWEHLLFNFFNLELISLSIYSLKNLYTKSQQATQKILNIEIDGKETKIIAKGSLPISTFLSDISFIAGTIGYFCAQNPFIKACMIAGGIIGNLSCKAFADDSNNHIKSSQGEIDQVNSNNTNIMNINFSKIKPEGEVAIALLFGTLILAASTQLICDKTPGDFRYKFYNQKNQEVPITLEWDNDDYILFGKYGEEITVL